MTRTTVVKQVIVTSISSASTFMAGDCCKLSSQTRALAVQRQVAVFFPEEGEFEDYAAFTEDIPKQAITQQVQMRCIQESPNIRVNRVDVIGVAEGSAMQLGSTRLITLESRIKHFRQFVEKARTE